jgi:hypothetical protein
VRSPEIARESESFVGRRTHVTRSSLSRIQTSRFIEGNLSTLRVVNSRENRSHPSKEDRWQRSRDLTNLEVRKVRAQELGAPSHEWQSRENIGLVHLKRTGGKDLGISNSEVHRVRAQELGAPSHEVAKSQGARTAVGSRSREDRWIITHCLSCIWGSKVERSHFQHQKS